MEQNEEVKLNDVTPYETVQERGSYFANGYEFEVEPIYFGEEPEYFSDVPLSFQLQKESEMPDEELSKYLIALFQVKSRSEVRASLGLFGKVKLWLVKFTSKKYKYYSDSPGALGLIKWLERKVKYKGKHIRFYDLERKYKLTKLEIAKMYRYLEKMSGF